MRRSLLLLALAASIAPGFVAAQEGPARTRVVVQVSDADPVRWNLALNNVRNLQDELGAANVAVEIVAYGPGIAMLKFDAPSSSRTASRSRPARTRCATRSWCAPTCIQM